MMVTIAAAGAVEVVEADIGSFLVGIFCFQMVFFFFYIELYAEGVVFVTNQKHPLRRLQAASSKKHLTNVNVCRYINKVRRHYLELAKISLSGYFAALQKRRNHQIEVLRSEFSQINP